MIRKKKKKGETGAINLLEETFYLLRTIPLAHLFPYYLGSAPFVLGFLYFWGDMSRGAFSYRHIGESVLVVSLLFIWMKCWQSVFTARLLSWIKGEPPPSWSAGRVIRMSVEQTFIQPTGLFLLPILLFLMVPFGWGYAWYQNTTVYGNGASRNLRDLLSSLKTQSLLFPEQNHTVLLILSLFGPALFLNILILIYAIPWLLQTLLGLETAFKGWHLMNTTLWMISMGIAYLLLDPAVKSLYTLRCFYGEAIRSGEDLIVELKGLSALRNSAVALIFVLFFTAAYPDFTPPAQAAEAVPEGRVAPADINRSAEEVVQRREFSWRFPRQNDRIGPSREKGPIGAFLDTLILWAKHALKTIFQWIGDAIEWIFRHFFKQKEIDLPGGGSETAGWSTSPLIMLYLLVGATASLLGVALFRAWRKYSISKKIDPQPAALPEVNLMKEEIKPDDLPVNQWLDLARELLKKGETRLALRAFFLACLACLAEQRALTIAQFKSNREYEIELKRNLRDDPQLIEAFTQNRYLLEQVWYGRHETGPELVREFSGNHERIMSYAGRK